MKRPNILIFCTDQQRADHLGCAGNDVLQTPNIDRIARKGVRFSSCYTTSPACMPARATMFTGLTNRATGCRTNGISLHEDVPTVAGLLADSGYRTHSAGKLHLKTWSFPRGIDVESVESPHENPERRAHWDAGTISESPDDYYGFQTQDSTIAHGANIRGDYKTWLDTYHPGTWDLYKKPDSVPARSKPEGPTTWDLRIDPELHYNHWIADRSIDFLESQADGYQPFFLWCSFPDPHSPFAAVEKWAEYYRDAPIELPPSSTTVPSDGSSTTMAALNLNVRPFDSKALVDCIRSTYAMVSHIDEQVGRVLDVLDDLGLSDNTVVMYTSDHGDQLGEHGTMHKGYFPHDAHARVPLVAMAPARTAEVPKGMVMEQPVSLLDLAPTVLDIAGVQQPEDELMNDDYRAWAAPLPDPLPGESLVSAIYRGENPKRRTALVEFDDENVDAFDLLQMRMLVTSDYKLTYFSPTGELLLFDRVKDPWEMNNLAKEPEYKGVVGELLGRLLKEISRTEPRMPRRYSGA